MRFDLSRSLHFYKENHYDEYNLSNGSRSDYDEADKTIPDTVSDCVEKIDNVLRVRVV